MGVGAEVGASARRRERLIIGRLEWNPISQAAAAQPARMPTGRAARAGREARVNDNRPRRNSTFVPASMTYHHHQTVPMKACTRPTPPRGRAGGALGPLANYVVR